ncbi:MAG: hypothetical protein WC199_10820, partial [Dysgonamonadaceae bacterium]
MCLERIASTQIACEEHVMPTDGRNLINIIGMLHFIQHDIKERRDASHSFSMTGTKKREAIQV